MTCLRALFATIAVIGCAGPDDPPDGAPSPAADCGPGHACVQIGVPGIAGALSDGRPAAETWLYQPQDVTPTDDGFYVADTNNHVVRRVDDADGIATVIAGSGYPDFGTGGPALEEPLHTPSAAVPDPSDPDVLWLAVPDGHRIGRLRDGVIDYPYGLGEAGFTGDGGPAARARFNKPGGITFDTDDGAMYVADRMNQVVRRIDADGVVTTVAGTPGVAGYGGDGGLAVDALLDAPIGTERDPANRLAVADGTLWIADTGNGVVRAVDLADGTIRTVATGMSLPHDLAPTGDGGLVVSDTGNGCVRRFAPDGTVTTVVGICGAPGHVIAGALATETPLALPVGVAVDAEGAVWVTDMAEHVVIRVEAIPTEAP